jgi:hypothetical protein
MCKNKASFLSLFLLRVVGLVLIVICYFGTAHAYNSNIFSINAKPALVYEVGSEYWFYDGNKGSNKLGFLPDNPITASFKIECPSSFPINSCLIQALIAYNHNRNHRFNAIVFLPHHAFNLYSDSDSNFKRALALFPAVDIYGVSYTLLAASRNGSVCYASTL